MTKVSFRWGIPEMDDRGGIYVFGFMLRNYARAGVTRDEMLCMMHLAAHHFERADGEAACSLATVATLMGYAHENSVRRLAHSLRDKELLEIVERPGQPSVYVAHKFAQRMLELEAADTPTLECRGTSVCRGTQPGRGTLEGRGGVHPSVPEKEKEIIDRGDVNLEIAWGMLRGLSADDAEGSAVWQLQKIFAEVTGIKVPDIDSDSGRQELAADWWPHLIRILRQADGDMETARAGILAAQQEMDGADKALTLAAPRSLVRKAVGIIGRQRRQQANGSGGHTQQVNGQNALAARRARLLQQREQ